MSEFTPTPLPPTVTRIRLPWRSVYTPVVPCVLDGALSLLELIAKLEYIINQHAEAISNNHTDIVNLKAYIDELENELRAYIDQQDAATLAAANAHSDAGDVATLAAAKNYVDQAISSLRAYVDSQDSATLTAAKNYTDSAIATLTATVNAALSRKLDIDGDANNVTFTRISTERDFVNIPANTPTTFQALITILGRWYEEIAGKQDALTFDLFPTENSTNVLTSGTVYSANAALANRLPYRIVGTLSRNTPVLDSSFTYTDVMHRISVYSAFVYVDLTVENSPTSEHYVFRLNDYNSDYIRFVREDGGGAIQELKLTSNNEWLYSAV